MNKEDLTKEFFDKLSEILEKEFEKGERCQECGGRLPCRSKALVLNAYANIYLKEALEKQKEDLIKKIEGMKKSPKNETRELVADIHNQALQDIINLIQ